MSDGLKRYFLVISQAKTGTTTLGQVLPAVCPAGTYIAKFHDHRLRLVDPATTTPKKFAALQHDLGVLDGIRALNPETSRLVVVTAVRDPVARIYSHFFEKGVYPSQALRGTTEADWSDERFVETFRGDFRAMLKPLLRVELKFLTEILNDGLALEFPNLGFRGIADRMERVGPYARYQSGAIVGLVLPHDGLLATLRQALADLGVGAPEIPETVAYAGESRGFGRLYQAFMDQVPFPDKVLELAYRSPMPRLLYSPKEIVAMRQRWIDRWRTGGWQERLA
jgi:hypothetical protein